MRPIRRRSFPKIISVLLALSILLIMTLSYEPKVQAKKDDGQPIVIDKGTEQEYQIPYDGIPVFEPELIKQKPKFDDFVQSKNKTVNFKRELITGVSSVYDNYFNPQKVVLSNGNIIATLTHGNWNMGLSQTVVTEIVLLNSKGEIINRKFIAGENRDIHWSGDELKTKANVANVSLFKNTDSDTVSVYYGGQYTETYDENLNLVGSSDQTVDYLDFFDKYTRPWLVDSLNTGETITRSINWQRSGVAKNHIVVDIKSHKLLAKPETLVSKYSWDQLMGGPAVGQSYEGVVQIEKVSNGWLGVVALADDMENGRRQFFLVNWDQSGNIIFVHHTLNSVISIQKKLLDSSQPTIYFMENANKYYLKSLNLNTHNISTLKRYPRDTNLIIQKDVGGEYKYSFYGSTVNLGDDLEGFVKDTGSVIGFMDDDFSIAGLTTIKSDVRLTTVDLVPITDNNYIITGRIYGQGFVDKVEGGGTWANKQAPERMSNAFSGILNRVDDWSPVINTQKDLLMDVTDTDWKTPNMLNNMLIKGNKLGDDLTPDYQVKVYDNHDFNYSLDPKDQAWLDARINRNPKDTSLPIDWKALGLNLSNTGPQQLTYFVTDSQMQTTSSSRWLNKVDDKTVYTKEYALRVENFDIPIDKVESLTSVVAKNKGKIQLWELFGDHKYIDDGTSEKDTATVDTTQLKAIQNAKTAYDTKKVSAKYADFEDYSEIIKPYPLTISYTYKNEKGEEKTLKREITVFVTNETTKVDKEKNQVIYGFNFRYPLKEAETLSDQEIAKLSHASLWKYDHFWDKDTSSTTLTTNREAVYQEGVNEPKTGLNNARSARKDYELHLMTKEVTNDLIRVWLADDPVYLNVRQIVQTPHEELVIPTNGYLDLEQLSNNQKDIKQEIPIVSLSGTDGSKINYEKVQLPVSFDNYFYSGEVVIPEYYQYVGYQLSETETNDGLVQMGKPIIDYQGSNNEYWLTFIIKPSIAVDKSIGLYGWDYGQKGGYSITK
ncbi:hypothetical protein [Vagococcus fluvialis]|uniref:hypothetical protein n=1 Tax=Vagococcus fluvialis TaxID=2738 RepID=UPI003797121C